MVGSMGKAGRSIVIAQNYWRGKCRLNRTKWERREVIWQGGSLISRQIFLPEDHAKFHRLPGLELVTTEVFSTLIFMAQMTPLFGTNWRRSALYGELCFRGKGSSALCKGSREPGYARPAGSCSLGTAALTRLSNLEEEKNLSLTMAPVGSGDKLL